MSFASYIGVVVSRVTADPVWLVKMSILALVVAVVVLALGVSWCVAVVGVVVVWCPAVGHPGRISDGRPRVAIVNWPNCIWLDAEDALRPPPMMPIDDDLVNDMREEDSVPALPSARGSPLPSHLDSYVEGSRLPSRRTLLEQFDNKSCCTTPASCLGKMGSTAA